MDIKGTVINFDDITPSAIGAINTEVLSNAEYEALEKYDEDTLYIISDGEEYLNPEVKAHLSNEDMHVTAEEKAKWNDQTGSSLCVQNIMIPASGWQDERETTAMYRYRIYNSNILENMKVNVDFKTDDATEEEASSLVKATNGGVLSITTANAGYVDIYAADNATFGITAPPTGNLKADLTLTQIKVV